MWKVLEQLRAGDHIASFYRSRSEQFEWIVPFIAIGLQRNERCLYIADNNSVWKVLKELDRAGIDVDAAQRKGALRVVTKQETYLRNGIFDPEKMLVDLKDEVIASLKSGYNAFRATGEMTWALDLPSSLARVTAYEAMLQADFPENFIALCQYDETRFPERVLSEMIRIHPKVIARGQLISNSFYLPEGEGRPRGYPAVTVDELVGN